jgi:hypothetical protein
MRCWRPHYRVAIGQRRNFFITNVISLAGAAIVMLIGLPFIKSEFDFSRLREYTSEHRVRLQGAAEAAVLAPSAKGGE